MLSISTFHGLSSEFEGLLHSVDEFSRMLKNSYATIPIFIFSFEKRDPANNGPFTLMIVAPPPFLHFFSEMEFRLMATVDRSSTGRSWRGWTANSRHRHEQQMRQQWQQERKFLQLAGEKGSSSWIVFEWEALQMPITMKFRKS